MKRESSQPSATRMVSSDISVRHTRPTNKSGPSRPLEHGPLRAQEHGHTQRAGLGRRLWRMIASPGAGKNEPRMRPARHAPTVSLRRTGVGEGERWMSPYAHSSAHCKSAPSAYASVSRTSPLHHQPLNFGHKTFCKYSVTMPYPMQPFGRFVIPDLSHYSFPGDKQAIGGLHALPGCNRCLGDRGRHWRGGIFLWRLLQRRRNHCRPRPRDMGPDPGAGRVDQPPRQR